MVLLWVSIVLLLVQKWYLTHGWFLLLENVIKYSGPVQLRSVGLERRGRNASRIVPGCFVSFSDSLSAWKEVFSKLWKRHEQLLDVSEVLWCHELWRFSSTVLFSASKLSFSVQPIVTSGRFLEIPHHKNYLQHLVALKGLTTIIMVS